MLSVAFTMAVWPSFAFDGLGLAAVALAPCVAGDFAPPAAAATGARLRPPREGAGGVAFVVGKVFLEEERVLRGLMENKDRAGAVVVGVETDRCEVRTRSQNL